MKGAAFLNWASSRCADLSAIITLLGTAITEEIPKSWGKLGEPGDPLEIKRAVEQVISGCDELLEWESDLHSIDLPEPFMPLKQMMTGWTSQTFNQMDSLAARIAEPIQQPDLAGEYVITVVFKPPSNMEQAKAEIERLKNHPEEWMDDYF
jgi:hypothetical protein